MFQDAIKILLELVEVWIDPLVSELRYETASSTEKTGAGRTWRFFISDYEIDVTVVGLSVAALRTAVVTDLDRFAVR